MAYCDMNLTSGNGSGLSAHPDMYVDPHTIEKSTPPYFLLAIMERALKIIGIQHVELTVHEKLPDRDTGGWVLTLSRYGDLHEKDVERARQLGIIDEPENMPETLTITVDPVFGVLSLINRDNNPDDMVAEVRSNYSNNRRFTYSQVLEWIDNTVVPGFNKNADNFIDTYEFTPQGQEIYSHAKYERNQFSAIACTAANNGWNVKRIVDYDAFIMSAANFIDNPDSKTNPLLLCNPLFIHYSFWSYDSSKGNNVTMFQTSRADGRRGHINDVSIDGLYNRDSMYYESLSENDRDSYLLSALKYVAPHAPVCSIRTFK